MDVAPPSNLSPIDPTQDHVTGAYERDLFDGKKQHAKKTPAAILIEPPIHHKTNHLKIEDAILKNNAEKIAQDADNLVSLGEKKSSFVRRGYIIDLLI